MVLRPNKTGKYFYIDLSKTWEEHWFSFILDHPELFQKEEFSHNSNLDWDIICEWQRYPNTPEYKQAHPLFAGEPIKWNYGLLSSNSCVTWDIIQANPDLPWDYRRMCANSNITWEIIEANPIIRKSGMWLSRNPNITWEIVEANPSIDWDMIALSSNSGITWDVIRANPRRWSFFQISKRADITWEIICSNPGFRWQFSEISYNPNITWEIVQANPKLPWNYEHMSANPNITMEIVDANPDKPWNAMFLGQNPNITRDMIKARPQWAEALFHMEGYNETISWETVKSEPEFPWLYSELLCNSMAAVKRKYERERMIKYYYSIEEMKRLSDSIQ
jgi:hypothetical protein